MPSNGQPGRGSSLADRLQTRGARGLDGAAASSGGAARANRANAGAASAAGAGAPDRLWVYVIDNSEAARSEDVAPSRARFALSSVRSLSKAALALPHAPDDAAVVVAAAAPRVLVPPGADDGGLLFADPWQPSGGAAAGDAFALLPALRLALLLCRQRASRPGPAAQPLAPSLQQLASAAGISLHPPAQLHHLQQQYPGVDPTTTSYAAAGPASGHCSSSGAIGGRVVVFVCSAARVPAADVDAALEAFAASPLTIGLDVVLLGGAAGEVDAESRRQLQRLVRGLNGDGDEGSGGTDEGSSSSTDGLEASSSTSSSSSASEASGTPSRTAGNAAAAATSSSSATAAASSPCVPATPLPLMPAVPSAPPGRGGAVRAAAAVLPPPPPPRPTRAQLVAFAAPDSDAPAWQQLEPLLELLEIPAADHDLDCEVGRVVLGWVEGGGSR
jgi:hypothetical protein